MLQGLRTVIHHLSDPTAATTFYAGVVGHAPYFNEPLYIESNVDGYELGYCRTAMAWQLIGARTILWPNTRG